MLHWAGKWLRCLETGWPIGGAHSVAGEGSAASPTDWSASSKPAPDNQREGIFGGVERYEAPGKSEIWRQGSRVRRPPGCYYPLTFSGWMGRSRFGWNGYDGIIIIDSCLFLSLFCFLKGQVTNVSDRSSGQIGRFYNLSFFYNSSTDRSPLMVQTLIYQPSGLKYLSMHQDLVSLILFNLHCKIRSL